jgi:hypothetical protein
MMLGLILLVSPETGHFLALAQFVVSSLLGSAFQCGLILEIC